MLLGFRNGLLQAKTIMRTSRPFELSSRRHWNPRFGPVLALCPNTEGENAMTGLKLLGAAAILSSVLAVSAAAQEAVHEPGALGQHHPFVDYLTGGYGVHGTSRGQYGSYDGDYGMMIGPSVIVTVPDAYAYYDAPCVRGTWYVGADGLRRFCR